MEDPDVEVKETEQPVEKQSVVATQALVEAHRAAQQHMNQGRFSVNDFREIASAYGRYVMAVKGTKSAGK